MKGRVLAGVPMAERTTIGIGGPADLLVLPGDIDDLRTVLDLCLKEGVPCHVIGRGSNLLVRDGGIRGVVIDLSEGFKRLEVEGEKVVAEAGVALKDLLHLCMEKGLSGLEFLTAIPGSVGGAIAMNAGAYGYDVGMFLRWIEVLTWQGEVVRIERERLLPRYRGLSFSPSGIILRGAFGLREEGKGEVERRIADFRRRRQRTQRVSLPSAGSIFKNPGGVPAGRLIEEAGLKGLRIGDAMVSPIHGNYIVNCGDARAADVLALIDTIRERVLAMKGIDLELEIKVLGEDGEGA